MSENKTTNYRCAVLRAIARDETAVYNDLAVRYGGRPLPVHGHPLWNKAKQISPTSGRLIVALDMPTINSAISMLRQLYDLVSFFKIGPALYFSEGVDTLVRMIVRPGLRLFLDAKLYDIPSVVHDAAARAADRGIAVITAHAVPSVLEAAVKGAGTGTRVFAVTRLTSEKPDPRKSRRAAWLAEQCGCAGIVCSATDLPFHGRTLVVATPGIRWDGDNDDHARYATPEQAIAAGARYLIIGRPITTAMQPRGAAHDIIARMETAL